MTKLTYKKTLNTESTVNTGKQWYTLKKELCYTLRSLCNYISMYLVILKYLSWIRMLKLNYDGKEHTSDNISIFIYVNRSINGVSFMKITDYI